jgi:hypothetical protein
MINILIIPIDNRPVCYDLPMQTASLCKEANIFIPPREFLGGLTTYANYPKILEWMQKTIDQNHIDYAILALDTIAYGGLVASRRIEITQDEIKNKITQTIKLLKASNAKILATSSIMRISNNNVNEEEKPIGIHTVHSFLNIHTKATKQVRCPNIKYLQISLRTIFKPEKETMK